MPCIVFLPIILWLFVRFKGTGLTKLTYQTYPAVNIKIAPGGSCAQRCKINPLLIIKQESLPGLQISVDIGCCMCQKQASHIDSLGNEIY